MEANLPPTDGSRSLSTGELLHRLTVAWHREHPRRARGGWWALAGFSFQTRIFLLRFFEGLVAGDSEPGSLAQAEIVSDIAFPEDGRVTLVQVKRSLDRHTLAAALAEAYLITDVCKREASGLLSRLRFQIACRLQSGILELGGVDGASVLGHAPDPDTWRTMLACFDPDEPIVEAPDPLDQLHVLLWNAGIANTVGLVEQCTGCLLNGFEDPSAQRIHEIGRNLAGVYYNAPRRDRWKPIGRLVTLADTAPVRDSSRGVLTGQTPLFEHLRKGYFRIRQEIEDSLWSVFRDWIERQSASQEVREKAPVFWIAGRSGEGKSILLLQLAARFIGSDRAVPLLHLGRSEAVPVLFESVPPHGPAGDEGLRALALVDDVYDVRDRDAWNDALRRSCALEVPAIGIVTCGPTEQMEQFRSQLAAQVEVTAFEVPPLAADEQLEFVEWYRERTGRERDINDVTTENPLLVLTIFELTQGMSLSAFAARFKHRLERVGLFAAARKIAAMNALYLDAPLDLIEGDSARDALDRLCAEDQLHFRINAPAYAGAVTGVRIIHAHLAWLLFTAWHDSSISLARAWARDVEPSLAIADDAGDFALANGIVAGFLQNQRLADSPTADERTAVPLRLEALHELYRRHIAARAGRGLSPTSLFLWLKAKYYAPTLAFSPDPAVVAIGAFADERQAQLLHGSTGLWAWLVADRHPAHAPEGLKEAAETFLMKHPNNPGSGFAVAHIVSRGGRAFGWTWVRENPRTEEAYKVLAPLVAADPEEKEVQDEALRWCRDHEEHPQLYYLLASLVAANPENKEVQEEALRWCRDHEEHPQLYSLLAPLVAANPKKKAVQEEALRWCREHAEHPKVYWLLAPVVAANPGEKEVQGEALRWCQDHEDHPHLYSLLVPLVAANPEDKEVQEEALRWCRDHEGHPHLYSLLAPLVAANPESKEVQEEALRWCREHGGHPQLYSLLAPLVASNPEDAEVRNQAVGWLEQNGSHTHRDQVLAPLIARSNGDPLIVQLGRAYLTNGGPKPEHIAGPLVKVSRAEPEIVDLVVGLSHTLKGGRRSFLLHHLNAALAYNPNRFAAYLGGPFQDRNKRLACRSAAIGLSRFPELITPFFEAASLLSPENLSLVIQHLIELDVPGDHLALVVSQWLTGNYRRRGYGRVLAALRRKRSYWTFMESLDLVPAKVAHDYCNFDP